MSSAKLQQLHLLEKQEKNALNPSFPIMEFFTPCLRISFEKNWRCRQLVVSWKIITLLLIYASVGVWHTDWLAPNLTTVATMSSWKLHPIHSYTSYLVAPVHLNKTTHRLRLLLKIEKGWKIMTQKASSKTQLMDQKWLCLQNIPFHLETESWFMIVPRNDGQPIPMVPMVFCHLLATCRLARLTAGHPKPHPW